MVHTSRAIFTRGDAVKREQLQDIAILFHATKRKKQMLQYAIDYYEAEQAEDAADQTEDDTNPTLTEP